MPSVYTCAHVVLKEPGQMTFLAGTDSILLCSFVKQDFAKQNPEESLFLPVSITKKFTVKPSGFLATS